MTRYRIIFFIVISLLLSNLYSAEAYHFIWKKKKQKTDTVEKKENPYEKFINKKGIKAVKGDISIFLDKEDVFLEIPDSLIGRKVMINSYISESSDADLLPGSDVSGTPVVFRLTKTDSLFLFRFVDDYMVVSGKDSCISSAIKSSFSPAIAYASPIIHKNPERRSYVIKANNLFDPSDKNIINLYALPFENGRIYKADYNRDLSKIKNALAFENSVSIVRDLTYKINIVIGIFSVEAEHELTGEFVSSISILPEKDMDRREADSRIGTRTIELKSISGDGPVKDKSYICKWDLSRGNNINIYIDTLVKPSWRKAIKEGIEAWNPAFERIGLGRVIKAQAYPSDTVFSAMNPNISTVSLSGGSGRSIGARIRTDKSTGEINRINITFPGDYLTGLRISSSTSISDVDKRYGKYFLEDDAICDVIKAEVMSVFGQCLGLTPNLAGSMAYSPEQLRDPKFTQENGITGSVTDKVLFNYIARPGDKEKGVVTIVDRIGKYDYYAIEWLYGKFKDSSDALDWLKNQNRLKYGKDEYVFIPFSKGNADPRALRWDLGNNPIEAYKSGVSHLKYAIANANKWLSVNSIKDENYKTLYIEYVWLKMLEYTRNLSAWAGGVESNYVSFDSLRPKFESIPEGLQREAMRTALEGLIGAEWMDNRALLDISGAYRTTLGFTFANTITASYIKQRLYYASMASHISRSGYTPSKLLDDVHDIIFAGPLSGRLREQEDQLIASYLFTLIGISPVMKGNYIKASTPPDSGNKVYMNEHGNEFRMINVELKDLRESLAYIPSCYTEELEAISKKYLAKAKRELIKCKASCSDGFTKGQIDYLLLIISRAEKSD